MIQTGAVTAIDQSSGEISHSQDLLLAYGVGLVFLIDRNQCGCCVVVQPIGADHYRVVPIQDIWPTRGAFDQRNSIPISQFSLDGGIA